MPAKRFVCLANSRKLGGRCVAGIELDADFRPGGWIRLVSARPGRELQAERLCTDGIDPKVLDVLEADVLRPAPLPYHPEDWLVDPRRRWRRVSRVPWEFLRSLVSPQTAVWSTGFHSYFGYNDALPYTDACRAGSSLRLIYLRELVLVVWAPAMKFADPRRRVQGRFVLGDREYRLWVTDAAYEAEYLARPDGEYRLHDCYVTISLSEPLDPGGGSRTQLPSQDGDDGIGVAHEKASWRCYKLLAAIIERTGEPA
ncbi:MAG: hypothetical protein RMJ05_05235 [Thermomicrobium sp.]|nr:hypothetical protein [Thermomicrobium sp.]MDW8006104.1 hypothetical protein [Thermomicrobium sp.]